MPRSPREAFSATTADIGAKNGSGWLPTHFASAHATVAAVVLCSKGQALAANLRSARAQAPMTRDRRVFTNPSSAWARHGCGNDRHEANCGRPAHHHLPRASRDGGRQPPC